MAKFQVPISKFGFWPVKHGSKSSPNPLNVYCSSLFGTVSPRRTYRHLDVGERVHASAIAPRPRCLSTALILARALEASHPFPSLLLLPRAHDERSGAVQCVAGVDPGRSSPSHLVPLRPEPRDLTPKPLHPFPTSAAPIPSRIEPADHDRHCRSSLSSAPLHRRPSPGPSPPKSSPRRRERSRLRVDR